MQKIESQGDLLARRPPPPPLEPAPVNNTDIIFRHKLKNDHTFDILFIYFLQIFSNYSNLDLKIIKIFVLN